MVKPEFLPKLEKFVARIGTLPTSYRDAMTYEEQILWLCNYIEQTVLPAINQNSEAIEELQGLFVQLKDYVDNYFEDLDIQAEVNNKINDLIENGTLQSIIEEEISDYREYVHIQSLGCIGDGTTDNAETLQTIFNTYKNIYIDDGDYYSSQTLTIPNDVRLTGTGTLKSNITMQGEIDENIAFTTIEKNKINSQHEFNVGDLLLVFYEEQETLSNNKRQMVETTSTDGRLSNNLCNYNNNYSVRLIDPIENINIDNITIDGNVIIEFCKNININKIYLKNGYIRIGNSYNINVENSILNLGEEKRLDVFAGSSNITVNNIKFYGGNTISDNSALKFNEVFYSNINNCNLGTPLSGSGTFHGIMIDGDFDEQNYPHNESQYININNCFVANGFSHSLFIALAKNINVNNFTGNDIAIKYSTNVKISNAEISTYLNERDNEKITFINSTISTYNQGTRKNTTFINCDLGTVTLAQYADNNKFISCKINTFSNSYVVKNSVKDILLDNCEIVSGCLLGGITRLVGKIKSHVNVTINQLYYSDIEIIIVENTTTNWNNLQIQSSSNNKIYYQIDEDALATTPLNNLLTDNTNILTSNKLYNSNNNNTNRTQAITKGTAPTSEDEQHYRGEIVWNYQPAAGGNVGWICVQNGKPGTWKEFGSISS